MTDIKSYDMNSNHTTLAQLFESQVEITPNTIAAVFGTQSISYTDLNHRANQLAHYLQQQGVTTEKLVGLCMERSIDMLVAMLAIIKSGGAYVALDPNYPQERLQFMLEDSDISLVITNEQHAVGLFSDSDIHTICLDSATYLSIESKDNPTTTITADNLAYVLFTSGSTGRPKGVMIEHRSVVALIDWAIATFAKTDFSGILASTSINFDLSIFEIFVPLCSGGTIILADNALQLPTLPHKHAVKLINTVPSAIFELLQNQAIPESVKTVCLAGEPLKKTLVDALYQLPHIEAVYNLYGPSEDTTYSTGCLVTKGSDQAPHIGQPISNTRVYILDEQRTPQDVGVEGELCIAGMGLARGYLKRPELTAEKFIELNVTGKSERIYKTGDLARWMPDGNLEFLGRIDNQVKIRGFRIETGEIEAALAQHPHVSQTAVVAQSNQAEQQRLVAYIVAQADDISDSNTDVAATDLVDNWSHLYDDAYRKAAEDDGEIGFHTGGWYDSYSGQAFPEIQLREWINYTVKRILALQPKRVLEIGCGTGFLLFKLAPQVEHYFATDIAVEGLRYIERQLTNTPLASSVQLQHCAADALDNIEASHFDTVVINGVVQYFPSIDYLAQVIENALAIVPPGGHIFVGDVESYPLMDTFHESVQLYRANDTTTTSSLKALIKKQIHTARKLYISPAFFHALKAKLPQISHVELQIKRGDYQNEITRFRYDAILHIGDAASTSTQASTVESLTVDWQKDNLNLHTVRDQLITTQAQMMHIRHIPNARFANDAHALTLLRSDECPSTVGELRRQTTQIAAIEPEQWWQWQDELPYRIYLMWSGLGENGVTNYDVIAIHDQADIRFDSDLLTSTNTPPSSWSAYASTPYTGEQTQQLIPELRQFLQQKLPTYMLPSAYVMLDKLPLTPNGKLDRKALPTPNKSRPAMDSDYIAPRTPTEEIMAIMWAEVLDLDVVGIRDNFFMLGGDSIQATQLVSRIRDTFKIELSLHNLFESPTIEELSHAVQHDNQQQQVTSIQAVERRTNMPLSFAEQRLWFLAEMQPESVAYNEQEALRLTGELNVNWLRNALQAMVERHEILRTNYYIHNGEPVRFIHTQRILPLPITDLRAVPHVEQDTEIQRLAHQDAKQAFDLENDSLLRVQLLQLADNEYILLLTMHHIVTDGWTMGILAYELQTHYAACGEHNRPHLPLLTVQYADFAIWQRQAEVSARLAPQLNYWQQQLANLPALLELPTDYPRPAIQTFSGQKHFFTLDAELTQQLKQLSQAHGCTLFMTLFTAFVILLHRYTQQQDIAVGTPIANRNRSELEGLIGFFVNTLVLRTQVDPKLAFSDLLAQVRQTALDAYAHQDTPFEQLVDVLKPERTLSHTPLFQVEFALQNAPKKPLELPDLKFDWLPVKNANAKFDLFLSLEETGDTLSGYWEYNCDLFTAERIERTNQHFKNLLDAVTLDPNTLVKQLPLLAVTEQTQLQQWSTPLTTATAPQTQTISQQFEAQAAKTPNAVAVIYEHEHMTYQQLNARANQVACYLLTHPAFNRTHNSLVAICVERSLDMLVGILGILKAGAAYVPIDPSSPSARIQHTLDDSAAPLLLTQNRLKAQLQTDIVFAHCEMICIDKLDWQSLPSDNIAQQHSPTDLAYIIYTSGSTGKPKGCKVSHANVMRLFSSTEAYYQFNHNDVWTLFHSYAFDFSVWEIWGALLYGGKLVIVPYFTSRNPDEFYQLLINQKVTVLNQTPSAFGQLINLVEQFEPLALRWVIFSGETLDTQQLQPWFAYYGDTQPQLVNMYGITETTVFVTYAPVSQQSNPQQNIIGKPLLDLRVWVVDAYNQPLPIGVAGELLIGGAGVTEGYLNNPELTAQRFQQVEIFGKTEYVYRSGDLVRWLPNGELEYIERIDQQVQLRGFRIELGEIEAVLLQHPAVKQAAVIVQENSATQQLVAYLTTTQADSHITGLRNWIKQYLPDYMIPTHFHHLESLPLTLNGKADRQALENYRIEAPDQDDNHYSAPRTQVEIDLCHIWTNILGLERVGIHDNFFDLGGHSLLAVKLIHQIQQKFAKKLPLTALFQNPTIEQLAQQLQQTSPVANETYLVPLQSQGNSTPLYLLPGAGSYLLSFRHLVNALGKGQPVYGLQTPGLEGKGDLPISIEQHATTLWAELSQQLPDTFTLVGHSYGGFVATELAHQLTQQGKTPQRLIILDTPAPRTTHELDNNEIDSLWEVFNLLSSLHQSPVSLTKTDLNTLDITAGYNLVMQYLKTHNIFFKTDSPISELKTFVTNYRNMRNSYYQYKPTYQLNCPITLLKAQDTLSDTQTQQYHTDWGWQILTTQTVETYMVSGQHFSMLQEGHVDTLLQYLKTGAKGSH